MLTDRQRKHFDHFMALAGYDPNNVKDLTVKRSSVGLMHFVPGWYKTVTPDRVYEGGIRVYLYDVVGQFLGEVPPAMSEHSYPHSARCTAPGESILDYIHHQNLWESYNFAVLEETRDDGVYLTLYLPAQTQPAQRVAMEQINSLSPVPVFVPM